MVLKEVDPRERLREIAAAYPTQQALAEEWGITPSYLSELLSGKRDVSDRILALIGLRATVVEISKSVSKSPAA